MKLRLEALKRLIDSGDSSQQEIGQYIELQRTFAEKRDHIQNPHSTPESFAHHKGKSHDT